MEALNFKHNVAVILGGKTRLTDLSKFVVVPSLSGLTQAAANTALANALLRPGTVTGTTDPVTSQAVVAGTRIAKGSLIAFTISATVPNVVGQTQATATSNIIAAGLVVGTVTGTVNPVLSQSPVGGTVVTPGSAVNLTMSA